MKHAGIFVMGALSILYIATILFLRVNDAWGALKGRQPQRVGRLSRRRFHTPWLSVGWYTGISYSPKSSAFSARN